MDTVGLVVDTHYGHPKIQDTAIESALQKLQAAFRHHGVDHIFVLGDVIHENDDERGAERLQHTYDIFSAVAPTTITAGNHDSTALSKQTFREICQPPTTTVHVDGTAFFVLDTGFTPLDVENVGMLSSALDEYSESDVDEGVVLSHFPLRYTDAYQQSPFFGEYPEGVFALDKFHYEQARARDDTPRVLMEITGHLHESFTMDGYYGLPAFANLKDLNVRGSYGIYTTQANETTVEQI